MNQKITFATNTAPNTLEYTKLLLKSLKENLDNNEHEILVFVDADNDGTVNYLTSIKNSFHNLKIVTHNIHPVVGPEINQNLIVELASHDIVSYLQSDMIVSKHYDTNILKHLKHDMILSSTRIEPPLHGMSNVTITKNFGLSPDDFKWDDFINFSEQLTDNRIIDYFFAPYTFYKDTWNKLGGYDTMFRRSRCDTDLVQRCLHLGIQLKQTFAACVYHFTCVSSRGKNWFDKTNSLANEKVMLQEQADKIELRRYLRKWAVFTHNNMSPKKLDIDLVLAGNNEDTLNLAYEIEPFFSRVWVQSENLKKMHLLKLHEEHQYANRLYNFSDDDWERSKHLYRTINFNNVINIGAPDEYNIKVLIDTDKNFSSLLQNIHYIHILLKTYSIGDYQLDDVVISIKKHVEIDQELRVNNPIFDHGHLKIS